VPLGLQFFILTFFVKPIIFFHVNVLKSHYLANDNTEQQEFLLKNHRSFMEMLVVGRLSIKLSPEIKQNAITTSAQTAMTKFSITQNKY